MSVCLLLFFFTLKIQQDRPDSPDRPQYANTPIKQGLSVRTVFGRLRTQKLQDRPKIHHNHVLMASAEPKLVLTARLCLQSPVRPSAKQGDRPKTVRNLGCTGHKVKWRLRHPFKRLHTPLEHRKLNCSANPSAPPVTFLRALKEFSCVLPIQEAQSRGPSHTRRHRTPPWPWMVLCTPGRQGDFLWKRKTSPTAAKAGPVRTR